MLVDINTTGFLLAIFASEKVFRKPNMSRRGLVALALACTRVGGNLVSGALWVSNQLKD
jgi:hypothetical protein